MKRKKKISPKLRRYNCLRRASGSRGNRRLPRGVMLWPCHGGTTLVLTGDRKLLFYRLHVGNNASQTGATTHPIAEINKNRAEQKTVWKASTS